MDRLKSPALSEARQFFSEELRMLLGKHHVTARNESLDYLVDLMLRYMESETFFVRKGEKLENNVLAELYAEYIKGDPEKKKLTLRRLGDICLLVSGFFADSLKRKIVDIDYYFGMGGTAYWKLSHLQMSGRGAVYGELAQKFRPFANVLGELSERSGLQTNSDLLRLYERWLFTGSERLRSLLSEYGIAVPVKINNKTRH